MNPHAGLLEHAFTCPHCWEHITMLLEPGPGDSPGGQGDGRPGEQSYVEDCEVCCNPIRITYTLRGGHVESFDARPIGQ